MTDTDAPSVGLGHNRPPEPTPIERALELVANANRWTTERPTITSDELAGIAQEFVEQLRACKAKLEALSKEERAPHDQAIAEIRKRYRDPLELIGIAETKMKGLLSPYMQTKDERLKRAAEARRLDAEAARERAERAADRAMVSRTVEDELAQRRAAEEADEAERAAGKESGRARVKGDLGKKAMSLHPYWTAHVDDMALAFKYYKRDPVVIAAIEIEVKRAANRHAREAKDESKAPAGVRFINSPRAQ